MICLRLHELQVHVGNNVNVSVGIICPYKAQKAYLTKMVATLPSKSGMNVVVNTVDGFQGQEKDVIIVSLTSVGHASHFVRDPKRVNVALTRAKFALWVFGDDGAIRSAFPHWSAFVAYSEGRLGVSTKFAVSSEPKQIAYVQSLEKHMATEAAEYESISKILGSTEEWHIWSVVATDTLYTECKKLNIPAPALIGVLSELKMGRFRSSTRPYRREGILGELFYVRKIGDNCVVWTVEVRQKSHVIHLLSIVKTPQLSAMWTKFRDAMGQVDIEFVEACNGFTQSGDGVCIPNENFDNPPPRFGILLRSVSECSKVFEVTFQLVPNGDEEQFRSSGLYLLDNTQDEAVRIQTNCVIIGRGGSGKTSVLSRKIYTGFMNAIQSEIEMLPPRILFVSQSNLLVNSVKVEYSNLITAFFITQPAVKLWEDPPGQVVLLNRNPTFFSFMDLFMEIDRMCGDLSVMFDRKTSKTSHRFTLSDLVDFERFNRVYYSPANEDLKKRFSAVNVFTEIMSSIKKIDRHGAKRFLSETEYRHLPSELSVSDKDLIFTFYVRYEANKKSRFHVDMVDAMAHILSRGSKLELPTLDFIFVDEVQDLLQC
ncbi:hypothetical protein BCR33DRAFT_211090 [Rhizoclosmatium globosum]|uniref:DNA2/NAM7 helicase-like C-terminal domain-containing protein n=1 Tax=Rhizoclosmatium globosum TaxID=329046 RepID=A0A1Y2CCT0_9FUNG|nr:hypothetical protein BCR33DRAFT_211090 [Rhizoclosmatium globosum]|eukprot:ORY44848.1 hypothetical protein BCR33DRAFT_211090 [Rhizoclosmatium globosum]